MGAEQPVIVVSLRASIHLYRRLKCLLVSAQLPKLQLRIGLTRNGQILRAMLLSVALLLSTSQLGLGSSFGDTQAVLGPTPQVQDAPASHVVDEAILAALKMHSDPVDALLSLQPDLAADLALPRLLHVVGEREPEWLTEGDKLRLRRLGKKFVDITDHHGFYAQQAATALAGKASKLASKRQPSPRLVFTLFLQTYPSLRISASLSPSSPISRHRECTMS